MRRIILYIPTVTVLFIAAVYSANIQPSTTAPAILPGIRPEMMSAGFWIGIHPSPDKAILTSKQISKLNQYIIAQTGVASIPDYGPTKKGKTVKNLIWGNFYYILNDIGPLVSAGQKITLTNLMDVKKNMNAEWFPYKVKLKYGLVTAMANLRVMPTMQGIFNEPEENFDRLQLSLAEVGTPLAIMHKSKDGKWLFVRGDQTEGWIESSKVVYCSLTQLKNYISSELFLVVTSPKADLYWDKGLTKPFEFVRMGTRLPLTGEANAWVWKVKVPVKTKNGEYEVKPAYIKKSDVHKGYLPYTPRVILDQAFRLLYTPYGWGDMWGEQDCSRFIWQVFACAGIYLPRNTSEQILCGKLICRFETNATYDAKIPALLKLPPATSLIYKKGHIMLYLGKVGNVPYIMHDTWAYADTNQINRIIGGVTVSDVWLNKESTNGAILKEIRAAIQVTLP
ncbi:MAG: hypothetical protein HPY53_03980 [Brevinematales bacterium]|nr:hypothetical protein [Brevinematales bacterium]